jgi:hypothetical protein
MASPNDPVTLNDWIIRYKNDKASLNDPVI